MPKADSMKKGAAPIKWSIVIFLITAWIRAGIASGLQADQPSGPPKAVSSQVIEKTIADLLQTHGAAQKERIERGVRQAASMWSSSDGSEDEFSSFCRKYFVAGEQEYDRTIRKVDSYFESLRGRISQIDLLFNEPFKMPNYQSLPVEKLFIASIPKVDYYASKLAFYVALNFPRYSLDEMLRFGPGWNRRQWAAARIGEMFETRIPADVRKVAASFKPDARGYLGSYFIWVDRALTSGGEIIFPEGLRLNCHNGLRDNYKDQYTIEGGLRRQKLIGDIVLNIINQTIPRAVVNNHDLYWQPSSNGVYKKESGKYVPVRDVEPERNLRYQVLLNGFKARKAEDNCYSEGSTYITRTFEDRQMSEDRVEKLLLSIIACADAPRVAALISKRLGRPILPYDIWYTGFQAQNNWPAEKLNTMTRELFPTPRAFKEAIPTLLRRLGFSETQALFLGKHTEVVPIPSGGHATGSPIRGGISYMHTAFETEGLDYKGYRIGMHELGHTVHQNLAINSADYYFLGNVPTAPFAEAIADVLAYRNIQALGLEDKSDPSERYDQALSCFWYVFEHGGHALTELRVWRWMYEHPEANADQLKEAVLDIAKSVWNAYYAPCFGINDSPILSLYSHFIGGSLYLNSYAVGNIIMYQLYDYMAGKDFAAELTRMCRTGKVTPDLWMQEAVGSPISSAPLLRDVREALKKEKA